MLIFNAYFDGDAEVIRGSVYSGNMMVTLSLPIDECTYNEDNTGFVYDPAYGERTEFTFATTH